MWYIFLPSIDSFYALPILIKRMGEGKHCAVRLTFRPLLITVSLKQKLKQTPWPESASKLHRPSDRHLSSKLVRTFADAGCHVVSVTDPHGRNLGFLDPSRYFFFQLAPQLYSREWVDHVLDPLLRRKSDGAGNRTRTSGSVARNSDL
jgi:hypothetical protein